MEVGKAIYYLLSNDATVSGLVGTKIHPVAAPQNTLMPYVVYEERLADPIITKEGPVFRDYVVVDIVVHAKTYAVVQQILKAIRDVLEWYSGSPGATGLEISRITFSTVLAPHYERQLDAFEGVNRYQIKMN